MKLLFQKNWSYSYIHRGHLYPQQNIALGLRLRLLSHDQIHAVHSFLKFLFIYLWLWWVFVAVSSFSLVAVRGGYSLIVVLGLLIRVASLVEHMR